MPPDDSNAHPLRLRKKHGEGKSVDATPEDGARLLQAQSLRNATLAGLITIVVFCIAWIMLTSSFGRVFPWATVVLGWLIGVVVRRAGRGIDWRFPCLAAVLALLGALASNIVLAASIKAAEYDASTLAVLFGVTEMTWPVYFDEVWSVVHGFFAGIAAGLAAFLAPRRLTRRQRYALRLWQEQQHD